MATILSGALSLPVSATPASAGKQAEYRRIKAQVDQIDQRLDVVVEEYNGAASDLNRTQDEIKVYSAKLKAAEQEQAKRQAAINSRIAGLYREGGLSYLELLMSAADLDQFLYCLELVERLATRDAAIIAEIQESNRQIAAQRAILVEKEKQQRAIVADIKAKKDKIASQLNERNRLLESIREELAAEQREEARKQAKLRRSLKLAYKPRSGVTVSRGGGRSSVVGIAMGELGKPYSWGASGPGSFDCSGLTRYVYGQVGVSLPHSSRAQYGCGQHVSRDQLQPGDLVFFSRGRTISHVGIYVGGGNFIHAPRTGDVVKISSISAHGGYVGATRP